MLGYQCDDDVAYLGGGFTGESVYMKSLMLRSSRAFLGGGGFLGLWAAPGDIYRDISIQVKVVSPFIT